MSLFHYSPSLIVKGSDRVKESYIGSWKIPGQNVGFVDQRKVLHRNKGLVHHCSSSPPSTSTDQKVSWTDADTEQNGTCHGKNKLQLGYLVSDANWQVRRITETQDEMRGVADIQAEAFHENVFLFDDMFFQFFKAEVLSGLMYRLRNSPPDRYACLVAEPRNVPQGTEKELVGVVDVTVQRGDSVLHHLPGAEEYLYVSGIAVSNKYRRQKVATTLLKACDVLSAIWGFQHLVLRAYEDDYGAQKLYSNSGYRVVSGDPPWMSTWVGRRRRVLMVK